MLNYPLQNIANINRDVYLFNRQSNGKLTIQKDVTFYPYFYNENQRGVFQSIDGKKLEKIFCRQPSEVKRKRTEQSYESDVLFTKRYVIDKIGTIISSPTKYLFIDIEMQTENLPSYLNPDKIITCISIYNSLSKEIKTFWIKDNQYVDLSLEQGENELLKEFVKYIKEEQPDLLLGWNFVGFDYPYLAARIKKLWSLDLAELVSPILKTRYGRKEDEIPYPAGISILDYMDLFKKIYKTEVSYALDAIAHKYIGTELNKKVDFNSISEEIKQKNIEDVRKMILLEEKQKIISYYDEIRRMSKCLWEDLTLNSKVLDVMLLTEAKGKGIILPSKHYGEDIILDDVEFEGAYRKCEIGRFEKLYKLDLSSAYPMAIIDFCLDIANLTSNKNELKVDITDRETHEIKYSINFKQNSAALLPTLAKKLIIKKDYLKKQLKSLDPESTEAKDLQIKYDATKALVNSLFGVTALKIFRLYNVNIASAITSIVRDLLHYVETKLKERGVKIIYLDTDSVFVEANNNPLELCNQLIKQWAKEKYNKNQIGIEFDYEGIFEQILIVALCVHGLTKILTNKGWKAAYWIYQNQKNIKIATINEKTQKIEYEPLIKAIKKDINNKKLYSIYPIYHSKKGRFGTFTEDHKMLTEDGWKAVNKLSKKDKLNIGEYKPSKQAEEAFIGTFLGDSTISNGNLYITHCIQQKDYAKHKADLFFNKSYKIKYYKNLSSKSKNINLRIISNSSAYLKYIEDTYYKSKKIITKDLLNKFSIISLAYLFMDDGYMNINQKQAEIATCCFSYKENLLLSKKIIQLGIYNKILKRGKYYRIMFDALNTIKLSKLIAPYVIKEMNYKLRPEHRTINKIKIANTKEIFYSSFKKIKYKRKKYTKKVFDFVLKKNHNFITFGGVAHNCHYKGRLKKIDGKLKIEIKGIEAKRKDSSKFMQEFQTKLIDKILDNEPQNKIIDFINEEKENIKRVSIMDIGFPAKVNIDKEYKSVPIFVRALEYSKELFNFKNNSGDTFYWIYTESFGEATRKAKRSMKNKETGIKEDKISETQIAKNVLAYNEEQFKHIKNIDWKKIIDKTIIDKCEHIFEALKWDISLIKEVKLKKTRKNKND